MAVDCQEQRSAEDAGEAKTSVAGEDFVVEYVEYQASDQCEQYKARLDLKSLQVLSHARWEGESVGDRCVPKKEVSKLARPGDGARGRPILRLHVTWADLN